MLAHHVEAARGTEPGTRSKSTARRASKNGSPRARTLAASGRSRGSARARTLVVQAERARRQGELERAQALLRRALAADRRSLAALEGLGSIAFSLAQYERSVEYLHRAARLRADRARRWISLGDTYRAAGRDTEARRAYERARGLGSEAATGRLSALDRRLGRGASPVASGP